MFVHWMFYLEIQRFLCFFINLPLPFTFLKRYSSYADILDVKKRNEISITVTYSSDSVQMWKSVLRAIFTGILSALAPSNLNK